MSNKIVIDKSHEVIDTSVIRRAHKIQGITSDECAAWLKSPITQNLIKVLGWDGIVVALQFDESAIAAVIHTLVPIDIIPFEVRKKMEQ